MPLSTIELLKKSADFKHEALDNDKLQTDLFYFASLCDMKVIRKEIAHPFTLCSSVQEFEQVLNSAMSCSPFDEQSDLASTLLSGHVIVRIESKLYKLEAVKPGNIKPSEAVMETTIQGPQLAFSEDAETNLMIIRKKYPFASLLTEKYSLGKVSQTKCYMVYDNDKVDPNVLQDLKCKLEKIEADVVQATGQIESLITKSKIRWIPTMIITERPDRVVFNLAQGKVVLVLDGTPFTLVTPSVFYDFMSAMDDVYQPFVVTRALVVLRYIALLVTITLPALYISIVSYNPEIVRVQFALSLAGSRAAVPYPSFIEVLFMLFLIEALVEASLRLPRYIGSTATTVGGLILGQAAQQAGLVSSVMIIVTSVIAISNFLIPINAMSFAIRIAKYPLIILASCFGFVGLVAGLFAITLYVSRLESSGLRYFRFYIGEPAVSGYKEGDKY
ncbi:spore germination protein [Cohnella pontilimi]|uniref:Spore germination protein n=2 Tax=Cohnella pontilimi TaxID=2564100 RepID=A0A4U0FHQ6_9BACL|nr:spore germination protein [Cohnella pontilimi]